jgi:hypothetical protein
MNAYMATIFGGEGSGLVLREWVEQKATPNLQHKSHVFYLFYFIFA